MTGTPTTPGCTGQCLVTGWERGRAGLTCTFCDFHGEHIPPTANFSAGHSGASLPRFLRWQRKAQGSTEMLQCDKTLPGGRMELFPPHSHPLPPCKCSEKPLAPSRLEEDQSQRPLDLRGAGEESLSSIPLRRSPLNILLTHALKPLPNAL